MRCFRGENKIVLTREMNRSFR